MSKGQIEKLTSKPSLEEMVRWFSGECWHFWEQPDKIGIGQKILSPDKIGLPHQYGRIFSPGCELRWEEDRFWLASETADGQFEIKETEIILRGDEETEFRKITAIKYLQNKVVVYTRFKEAEK